MLTAALGLWTKGIPGLVTLKAEEGEGTVPPDPAAEGSSGHSTLCLPYLMWPMRVTSVIFLF